MTDRLKRADRRRLLKVDAEVVGSAIGLPPDMQTMQGHTRHLVRMLLNAPGKHRASQAASYAAGVMDATLQRSKGPAACGVGCHYCCKTFVSCTIPEILRLAHAVRGNAMTTTRVQYAAGRSEKVAQDQRERERVVCPILVNRVCSEYKVRPLVCRSVLSKSLEACLRIFEKNSGEELPYSNNTVDIRTYFVVIMQAALRLSDLPHRHYELNQALAVALATNNAEERWLGGEDIFQKVPIDAADLQPSALSRLVDHMVHAVQNTL